MRTAGFLPAFLAAVALTACSDSPDIDTKDLNEETENVADTTVAPPEEGQDPGGFQPDVKPYGEGETVDVK